MDKAMDGGVAERQRMTCIEGVGGGTRSAWSAGFLFALGMFFPHRQPDMVLGSSGAAGNVIYFAAGQYEPLQTIWTKEIPSEKFFSLRRSDKKPRMDVDYLVDEVFGKHFPLNHRALRESGTRYSIATWNTGKKETRYGTERDNVPVLELLRASKAVPLLYGKKVSLPWGRCIDGQVGCTTQEHVNHAMSRGAKRILVLDDSNIHPVLKAALDLAAGIEKKRTAPFAGDERVRVPEGTRMVRFAPRDLPLRPIIGNSAKEMRDTFDAGVETARNQKDEVLDLLGEKPRKYVNGATLTASDLIQESPLQAGGAARTSAAPTSPLR